MNLAVLDGLFRFQVGAWVVHRQDAGASPMLVISRTLEQCSGGVQCLYYVRLYSRQSQATALQSYSEIELEPAAPPEATATVPALLRTLREHLVKDGDFLGARSVLDCVTQLAAKRAM